MAKKWPAFIRNAATALLFVASLAVAIERGPFVVSGDGGLPPSETAGELRRALVQEGIRVAAAGAPFARFWFCRELSSSRGRAGQASPVLKERSNFGDLSPASLVGVVRFEVVSLDDRDREIPAGLYAMRYAIQPAIKEHRGVSDYRDFLILTPIEKESFLARSLSEAIAASVEFFGRGHPAVLAIFPAPEGIISPTIGTNANGRQVLEVKFGARAVAISLPGREPNATARSPSPGK